MRVALFTNNYLPFRGGVATSVETLREGLEVLGHRTWVFAPAPSARVEDPPRVFRYRSIPAPTYPGFALPLPFSPRLVAALAVRLSCRFANAADLVVAPSAGIAEMLHARGVAAPVAVVPTGVPVDRFAPGDPVAARRRLGLPADGPLCLYVGRLDREKSVDRVIAAFGSIAGAVSGVRLSLVGQGSHAQALPPIP